MKKTIKHSFDWIRVGIVSTLLVTLPILGCKGSPPMSMESKEQVAVLEVQKQAALDAGDMEAANAIDLQIAKIEVREGETFVGGFFDIVGQFIPGVEALKGAVVPLIASLAFPRPRELYLKALKGVGKTAKELNPIGSSMAPGSAVEALVGSFRDLGAAIGLKHTSDDPDQVIANGKKLKAKIGRK